MPFRASDNNEILLIYSQAAAWTMYNSANLEQSVLENLRQLPPDKQQEVLDFTEFLKQKAAVKLATPNLSLRQMAAMPLSERHQLLAQSIPATAQDFLTDPELTEFAALDTEDWEFEHD